MFPSLFFKRTLLLSKFRVRTLLRHFDDARAGQALCFRAPSATAQVKVGTAAGESIAVALFPPNKRLLLTPRGLRSLNASKMLLLVLFSISTIAVGKSHKVWASI